MTRVIEFARKPRGAAAGAGGRGTRKAGDSVEVAEFDLKRRLTSAASGGPPSDRSIPANRMASGPRLGSPAIVETVLNVKQRFKEQRASGYKLD